MVFVTMRQRGFTLIELVIAIAITASIGVISAAMLDAMLRNSDQLTDVSEQQNQLERVLQTLRSDLEQMALRPAFKVDTQKRQFPKFALEQPDDPVDVLLSFTRHRLVPTNQGLHPQLIRVRYLLQNQQLIRESYPLAYPTSEANWQRQPLLDQVDSVDISWLLERWTNELPELRQDETPLQPKAIRLVINSRHWQQLPLVVAIAGYQP